MTKPRQLRLEEKQKSPKAKKLPITFKRGRAKYNKWVNPQLRVQTLLSNVTKLVQAQEDILSRNKQVIPIQWLNYFTTTLYQDTKAGPREMIGFGDIPWATGSVAWQFWPRKPKWTKKKIKRIRNRERLAIHTVFPKFYFLKKRKKRQAHVPARYIYVISAMWTPYYITLFYLAKLYRKNVVGLIQTKKLKNTLLLRMLTRRRHKRKYSESKFSSIIVKFIKKAINTSKNLCYKTPSYFRQSSRRKPRAFFHKKYSYTNKYSKRKNRFIKKPFFYKKLNRTAFKTWFKNNKTWTASFIHATRSHYKRKKYIRNYLQKYVNNRNVLFKAHLGSLRRVSYFQNQLRRAHRLGTAFWTKKIFFFQWFRFLRWFAITKKKAELIYRVFIPHKFLHTQKNPKRYYSISRWNTRAFPWLNIAMHNRQLFPFQLLTGFTRETRHPNRRKRWKVYKWISYTLNNQWGYGMQAKKNYRLKQILFGRIVLPALGYLKQKQFIQIKRNAAHIKPLAVSNSRPGIFLGRFERRIDILTYKLNFAPTIQWARVFVEAGFIYVSYWTMTNKNYIKVLTKSQKFPLLAMWKLSVSSVLNYQLEEHLYARKSSFFSQRMFNTPLPITLASYRVFLKGIVHWTNTSIKTLFYFTQFKRLMPSYFLFNKAQTIGYFWRNLKAHDIDKLRRARVKKHVFNWLA